MASDVKLLPCPFCGAEAELQESEDLIDVLPAFWVSCKARCAAQTELSRDEAIANWNRRAPSPDAGREARELLTRINDAMVRVLELHSESRGLAGNQWLSGPDAVCDELYEALRAALAREGATDADNR